MVPPMRKENHSLKGHFCGGSDIMDDDEKTYSGLIEEDE